MVNKRHNILESSYVDLSDLDNLTSDEILQNYVITLLASLLLLKLEDARIFYILHDPNNKRMNRYRRNMSPLNFWGFVLNHPEDKVLKKFISKNEAAAINRSSGRILNSTWKYVHNQMSDHPNNIDWGDMMDQVRIITLRLNMRSRRIDFIRNALAEWDTLDSLDRSSMVSKMFLMMSQHDRNNILLSRLRNVSTTVLTNPVKRKSNIDGDDLVNTISDIKRGISNVRKMNENNLKDKKIRNGKKIVLRIRDFKRLGNFSRKRKYVGDTK